MGMNSHDRRGRLVGAALRYGPWVLSVVLLTLAAAWTSSVWFQNRAVRAALDRARESTVEPGTYIGDVVGVSLDGRRVKYELAGRGSGTLVVAFSVDCEFCKRNQQAWARLGEIATAHGVQVVRISRDSFERAHSAEAVPERALFEPTHSTYSALALSLVPRTIVTDRLGVVRDSQVGVLGSRAETSLVDAILAVSAASTAGSLPGHSPAQTEGPQRR